MTTNGTRRLIIEDSAGERFEVDVPADTRIDKIAADFFEERGWSPRDSRGRAQRAVADLVDPKSPGQTKRLRGEHTVSAAGLWDGATLRIFPESIAGLVNEADRVRILVADHGAMKELVKWNRRISFKPNSEHAPFHYEVTFKVQGFSALSYDGRTPIVAENHLCTIDLGADYPLAAPLVVWKSAIFHPNIRPGDGAVCLGVLMHRYLPGLGLSRLVTMLFEMVQWRNFDASQALNGEAAKWAMEPTNWHFIEDIGGSPYQGPVQDLWEQFQRQWQGSGQRPRIEFRQIR